REQLRRAGRRAAELDGEPQLRRSPRLRRGRRARLRTRARAARAPARARAAVRRAGGVSRPSAHVRDRRHPVARVPGLHGIRAALRTMLSAIVILTGLAMALTALTLAAARLLPAAEHGDVGRVEQLLPRIQCGQCGYPGCRPYAAAIVAGTADINLC